LQLQRRDLRLQFAEGVDGGDEVVLVMSVAPL
jgi:hypothetical protein